MADTRQVSRQIIADAAAAVEEAKAAMETVIRAEVTAGRATVTDVASVLQIKNRQRVYAILDRADETTPQPPTLPPVVYLRGAGIGRAAWDRIAQACWTRGWQTVSDRTTAWHHARAGRTVVQCDFSVADLDDEPVHVRAVTAKYAPATQECEVVDLLPTSQQVELLREGPEWIHTRTVSQHQDMELRTVAGGAFERPTAWVDGKARLDEWALTALIQQILDQA